MDGDTMNKTVIDNISLGKRIKAAREAMSMSQKDFAEEIGISKNFLSDIERGNKKPSLTNLVNISNFVKIEIDVLLAESLDNIFCEPQNAYYTDKQLKIIGRCIRDITTNFSL